MAANMADLEVAYRVMATPDPHVNIAASFPPPRKFDQPRNKVLGICKPWLDRAHPSVKESCQNAIDHLSHKMGYEVVDISIPYLTEGQMSHFMTLFSEVRATLSDVSELTLENQALLSILSACKTWDFMMAQKIRNVLMQHLAHLFEKYPGLVIVTPTVPDPPSLLDPVDEKYGISDLQSTAVRIIEYVWLANFSGTPSISFPVGYLDPVDGDGKLPVGMMGLGEWGSEDALIEFGYDGERYLHTGLQGGRQKPAGWVDSLDLARNS
jgi:Asp-tRNA(Asn)/Glu-tRNA(Gln) amidotransferase A subunit family amidase